MIKQIKNLESKLLSAAKHHFFRFEEIYNESCGESDNTEKRNYSQALIEVGIDRAAMLYHSLLGITASNIYKIIKTT